MAGVTLGGRAAHVWGTGMVATRCVMSHGLNGSPGPWLVLVGVGLAAGVLVDNDTVTLGVGVGLADAGVGLVLGNAGG